MSCPGAVRSSGLNKNDHDLDVGMTSAAFQVLNHTRLPFPLRYELEVFASRLYKTGKRDEALPARYIDRLSGMYLDIFMFQAVNESHWGPVASGCWHDCVACTGQPKRFVVPQAWIEPLERCEFEDFSVWCPGQPIPYLTHLYGDSYRNKYWRWSYLSEII
jgi:hypothetical protein